MAAKYLISNIDLILVRKAVHFFLSVCQKACSLLLVYTATYTVDDGDDAIRQGSTVCNLFSF